MLLLLSACVAPSEPVGPNEVTTDSDGDSDLPDPWADGWPAQIEDAITYGLHGGRDDAYLGWRTALGDIDGDGLDDIAMNGKYSAFFYLLLGKTLLAHPPGDYVLADIADYQFSLTSSDGADHELTGWDATVLLEPDHLYVSAPRYGSRPWRTGWIGRS